MVSSANEGCVFEERVDLLYNPKTMSVFIQTDKPVYNPGDEVRFRVVVVDADTKPVVNISDGLIQLADARGNAIMQWSNVTVVNGIFVSAHRLAASPILGDWSLVVRMNETVSRTSCFS